MDKEMKNPLDSLTGTVIAGLAITALHVLYMINMSGG